MMTHNDKLLDPQAFVVWVRRALADLRTASAPRHRPSHFLLDEDVPGSKNRVANMPAQPELIRLGYASRLEDEIRAEAKRYGVDLLPMVATGWERAAS